MREPTPWPIAEARALTARAGATAVVGELFARVARARHNPRRGSARRRPTRSGRARSSSTTRSRQGDDLPLAGVPFAVKDNIDVAGVADHGRVPGVRLRPRALGTGGRAAARRRRGLRGQDQPRPVRHRPRRHPLAALRRVPQPARSRADRGRLELRARRSWSPPARCRSHSGPTPRGRGGCRRPCAASSAPSPRRACCRTRASCRRCGRSTACRCSPQTWRTHARGLRRRGRCPPPMGHAPLARVGVPAPIDWHGDDDARVCFERVVQQLVDARLHRRRPSTPLRCTTPARSCTAARSSPSASPRSVRSRSRIPTPWIRPCSTSCAARATTGRRSS